MINLRQLLATWESWSAHNTLSRAHVHEPVQDGRSVSALDALRDSHELVELLTGWQWQAMHAARRDGVSWKEIGATSGTTAEQARAAYVAVLDKQEQVLGRDVGASREVL